MLGVCVFADMGVVYLALCHPGFTGKSVEVFPQGGLETGPPNGAGGTRNHCFLALGCKAPEGGVLGVAGAAGSWDLEGEDASPLISEPLFSEEYSPKRTLLKRF